MSTHSATFEDRTSKVSSDAKLVIEGTIRQMFERWNTGICPIERSIRALLPAALRERNSSHATATVALYFILPVTLTLMSFENAILAQTPGGGRIFDERHHNPLIDELRSGVEDAIELGNSARDGNPPRYQDAERAYRLAAKLDPKDPRPYLGLGNIFYDQGQLSKAATAYRQAVVLGRLGNRDMLGGRNSPKSGSTHRVPPPGRPVPITAARPLPKSIEGPRSFEKYKGNDATNRLIAVAATGEVAPPPRTPFAPLEGRSFSSRPFFAWREALGSKSYLFTLYDGDVLGDKNAKIVYEKDVAATEFSYPTDAPALNPGRLYSWRVSTPSAKGKDDGQVVTFRVLAGTEAAEVTQAIEQAKLTTPSSTTDLLDLATVFENYGVWYDALKVASNLASEKPDDAAAQAYYDSLLDKLALTRNLNFLAADIRSKLDAQAHAYLGNTLMGQGNLANAESEFRQAVFHDPMNAQRHGLLGYTLLVRHNYSVAS